MRSNRLVLAAILLIGAMLRFSGLDWSVNPQTGEFHRFHPDEATLVDSATWLGKDITQVKSAYGVIPVYILYAAGHASGLIFDFEPFEASDPRSEKLTFLTARVLSAGLGTATIFLVFLIGHRAGGVGIGIMAAALIAVSPGHIQQCHFYTLDASLAFWTTLALYLILLTPTRRWWVHALIGAVVGIAGGYRFVAAFLAFPYIVAQLWHPGDGTLQEGLTHLRSRLRRLIALPTLACGLIAGIVALVATPTLLIDPDSFFSLADQRNFIPSVDVATGKALRLWNLYDFTTTPYLFYLTDLFPAALGTVTALAALAGLVAFGFKPSRVLAILLAWAVAYFLMTGGLFTKPIRYTTPLLAILCCLAAHAWVLCFRVLVRKAGHPVSIALGLLVCVPSAAHGLAVSRVYTQENIRFEATRWIHENLPHSAGIMGETGGFPTLWMVDPFKIRKKDPGSLFMRTRHHVLPGNVLDILAQTVSVVDYWVLITQNRATPYASAPRQFPVAAQFYERLRDGRIGYERIARFARPAQLFAYNFDRENTDPTISAFDRPSIEVYRRTAHHDSLWSSWRQAVVSDPANPDGLILRGISEFQREEYESSLRTFEQAVTRYPKNKLAELCRVESIYRLTRSKTAQKAFEEARPSQWDFAGLTLAGLPKRGADYIRITQAGEPETPENLYLRQVAAKAFIKLGYDAYNAGDKDKAIAWYEKALELNRHYLRPFRGLGALYLEKEQFAASRDAFLEAIRIRANIDDLWIGLAVAQSRIGDVKAAYQAAREAIRLAPEKGVYHSVFEDLANYFRSAGQITWASELEAHLRMIGKRLP
jgi:tetratricopeptide (TPR) repeat protein